MRFIVIGENAPTARDLGNEIKEIHIYQYSSLSFIQGVYLYYPKIQELCKEQLLLLSARFGVDFGNSLKTFCTWFSMCTTLLPDTWLNTVRIA